MFRSLPDVPEPFDAEAFAHASVPDDQNAFDLYRQASERLEPLGAELADNYAGAMKKGWRELPDAYREWLERNRELLAIYRAGSERPDALYVQPGELMWDTQLPVTCSLGDLSRLAELEALRLEAQEDCSAAWTWYRAILMSGRHSGRHGGLVERMVGCTIYGRAAWPIARWASLSGVDAAMLRAALAEVRDVYAMTPCTSETLKADTFCSEKSSRINRCWAAVLTGKSQCPNI